MVFSLNNVVAEKSVGGTVVENTDVANNTVTNTAVENAAAEKTASEDTQEIPGDHIALEDSVVTSAGEHLGEHRVGGGSKADARETKYTRTEQDTTTGVDAKVHAPYAAADEHFALATHVKAKVGGAHEAVERKPVILEKLGRARGVVDVILKAGDVIGEVSVICAYDVLWLD